MTPSMAGEQGSPNSLGLFTAFGAERTSNLRWLFALAVPLFGLLAAWLSLQGQQDGMRIVTAHGIKLVLPGMSQEEVLGRLGHPIGKTMRADGAECFQHGLFSMTEPMTTVYELCYLGGVLQDVRTRRYSLWTVDDTGAFVPAGIPMEDPPEEGPLKP
ncbi:hypothetical protein [Hyalangium sp.]|uniref:hypothetical protein n=1 Tax=Hyalangium sp. TaxID=2028555 RepID=UPI002D5FD72E|nr:hypothetical protein [Hyalangium sp.]HYH96274.1 hypothetical protein [Hyalangium sp.]